MFQEAIQPHNNVNYCYLRRWHSHKHVVLGNMHSFMNWLQ